LKNKLPKVAKSKAIYNGKEAWLTKYTPPNVGDNKVVYKGKRYWIIEFTGKDKIDGLGTDDCQFVMYDKFYQAVFAIVVMKEEKYYASLYWGIDDISESFDTIKDVAKYVPIMDANYAKHCFG
jgi:hypothetical protein